VKAKDEPDGPHDPNRNVTRALLEACPSIESKWAEHLADWAPDQPPVYIDTMIFAHHFIDLVDAGRTEEMSAVFSAIDDLLRTGADDIRYLVTYGLLEGIQNIASHRPDDPSASRFRPWMLPSTEAAWDEVHRMWGTDPGPRDIGRR
jgi:hypothetical protein